MHNLKTTDFDFTLPPERIAQRACEPRDHARLLHLTPTGLKDRHIYDLPNVLKSGDILVLNNTRVIPARLYGHRDAVRIEILLHKKKDDGTWLAFARPGKRLRTGQTVRFGDDFSATILEKHDSGEILLRFSAQEGELLALLNRYGEPPLPPYIKREPGEARADKERYQTIFAVRDGAVAAPTAGLHFTPALLETLKTKGIDIATVTLHVGAGTFLPVKTEHVRDHVMHAEWGEISPETAQKLNDAHKQGRRIVAVGTTSLRVLESATNESGIIQPFSQETSIFITPGYRFRAVDVLLTNFHLPQSTLFMLVSAFMGLDVMRRAYTYAIENNYRFYSYGDACLLERKL